MAEYENIIELGVLEEEALQSIEKLLEKLGREPLPLEVKFFNSYNKREPKRDETYSRFNFPINAETEGIAVLGTMYVRNGSKRQENPHRIIRNCFKLLTALGAHSQGQFLSVHHAPLQNTRVEQQIDELISKLAYYSNKIGVPTLDISINEDNQFSDYTLLNMIMVGIKPQQNKPKFNLAFSKLVLVTPAFDASEEAQDIILSKLYAKVRREQFPLVFLISGRKGIVGQLLKHIKPLQHGARFFTEGFEGFVKEIDSLLIREFKTELVFLTQHPGDLVRMASEHNIEARIIGEIIEDQVVQIEQNGNILCRLPNEILTDEVQYPDNEDVTYEGTTDSFDPENVIAPSDLREVAYRILRACKTDRKKYIHSYFDNTVGSNNLSLHFPSDAAVMKLHGVEQALAIKLNSSFNFLHENLVERSSTCLAETARQIAACGGDTSYLFSNFNLKNTRSRNCVEVYNDHLLALQQAAQKLSKNHTHYEFNLDIQKNDDPRPPRSVVITGGIGIVKDTEHHMTIPFKNKGDLIFLIGESQDCINSSVYLDTIFNIKDTSAKYIDWAAEQKVQQVVVGLIQENIVCSAHSVGKGGLFVALVESCIKNQLGFDITSVADVRDDAFLFGEANGRILVSLTLHKRDRFIDYLEKWNVAFTILGHVTKGELRIEDKSYGFIKEISKWL